ncbi:hypothetical protein LTR36_004813 [Oleoguttula mirabilis]|uniref:Uncharacterized protein n=1 Tax=Oleoguttula mirabilis TaxID=1507867 RepID=A0AAV9JEW9_9PEZI|nr:hypothetical protein LTR36_004813 [Oleoguttula mirabilis]
MPNVSGQTLATIRNHYHRAGLEMPPHESLTQAIDQAVLDVPDFLNLIAGDVDNHIESHQDRSRQEPEARPIPYGTQLILAADLRDNEHSGESYEERRARRHTAIEETQAVPARRDADHEGYKLTKHYRKLPRLLKMFKTNLDQYAKQDAAGFKAFQAHIINAHIVTSADVRAYDIIRWYTKIPQNVKLPLNDLSRYYHEEAVLRSNLKHAEHRCEGNHLYDDEEFAVERFGCPDFGFEDHTNDEPVNGFTDYTPRFEGGLQVQHLLACVKVRKVRLEHVDESERCSPSDWTTSLDARVVDWLLLAKEEVEAEGCLAEDVNLTHKEKTLLDSTLRAMEGMVRRICQRARALIEGSLLNLQATLKAMGDGTDSETAGREAIQHQISTAEAELEDIVETLADLDSKEEIET